MWVNKQDLEIFFGQNGKATPPSPAVRYGKVL